MKSSLPSPVTKLPLVLGERDWDRIKEMAHSLWDGSPYAAPPECYLFQGLRRYLVSKGIDVSGWTVEKPKGPFIDYEIFNEEEIG